MARWSIAASSFAGEEHLPGVDLHHAGHPLSIEERRNIVGIVLTHAHEDHFGALSPVAAAPGARLRDAVHGGAARGKRLRRAGRAKDPVNVVPLGGRFTLGPFEIELIDVAHSIPESNALAIRTPPGTVLHTGDWKIDPTPVIGRRPTRRGSALGEEGVLALSAIPPTRSARAARPRSGRRQRRLPS